MGVEYDLISDATREGYELGKGPWGSEDFLVALRSADSVVKVATFLVEDGFSSGYATEIACEVAAFTAARPDWRVVHDCGNWDGAVVDDEERAEIEADEEEEEAREFGFDVSDFPLYRKVGSRYRRAPAEEPA